MAALQVVDLIIKKPVESLGWSELEALKLELMQLISVDSSKFELVFEVYDLHQQKSLVAFNYFRTIPSHELMLLQVFSGSSVIRVRIRSRRVARLCFGSAVGG